MSRLFHTEQGRVTPTLNEELSRHRRVRKQLDLPAMIADAELYVLARAHTATAGPLRVSVDGAEVTGLTPARAGVFRWYVARLPANTLQDGPNVVELWTDDDPGGWSLAMQLGPPVGSSTLSTDGGATWRNQDMGYLNVGSGDYVIRARADVGGDPPPPEVVSEDPDHPRLAELVERLPAHVRSADDPSDAARLLSSWTATLLEYRNAFRVAGYTPWDALTIEAWARADRGHDHRPPMAMCAHYTVLYVMACLGIGIPARCAVMTEDLNGWNGHFAAEVWLDGRWVFVDPTYDVVVDAGAGPLTFDGIRRLGSSLERAVQRGPGFSAHRTNPDSMEWFDQAFLTGKCFKNRGIWPRTDFLSHPELTPPGHGAVPYCETAIVWERSAFDAGFGMFSRFAEQDYFDESFTPRAG